MPAGKESDKTAEPREGAFCPWAREAAIANGKDVKADDVACLSGCAKFGHYYPDGRLDKAVGCTRRT